MSQSNSYSGGVGFLGLLALIFITLKLVGVITWSWWWVLAPLWGPLAFVLGIGCIVAVGIGLFFATAALFGFIIGLFKRKKK